MHGRERDFRFHVSSRTLSRGFVLCVPCFVVKTKQKWGKRGNCQKSLFVAVGDYARPKGPSIPLCLDFRITIKMPDSSRMRRDSEGW